MVHFTVYAFWNFGIIFYTALPEMHFLNFIFYFLFYAIIRNLIHYLAIHIVSLSNCFNLFHPIEMSFCNILYFVNIFYFVA